MPIVAQTGKNVYRRGDTSNGLYGILTGAICVEGGHDRQTPNLSHIMRSGEWFGIKAVVHGGPRELTFCAIEPSKLLFVSNAQILPLMQKDPDFAIRVGQMGELGGRLGFWMVRDLLTPDAGQRLAAVLFRVTGNGEVAPDDPTGFWLTHQQLGEMANLSRHHVGRKLAGFEAAGWVRCRYNRILILDAAALAAYAYDTKVIRQD